MLFKEVITRNKKRILDHLSSSKETFIHINKPYNYLRKVEVIDELSKIIRPSEAEILFKIPILISMIFMSIYRTLGGDYTMEVGEDYNMEKAKGWGQIEDSFISYITNQIPDNSPNEILKKLLDYLDTTPHKK
jgi:hypothetical protein